MQTQLGHVLFAVAPANLAFYRDLMAFLGWQTIYEGEGMLGVGDSNGVSLWFGAATKDAANDYDAPGMNHLAISTRSTSDVDGAANFLRERNVELLFDTPRHRPEFSVNESQTYYQIMFETPDRILLEIVYIGARAS